MASDRSRPAAQSSEQHDTYELRETWHTTAQPGESKVDGTAVSESELIALDTYGEVPPATRDEMFAIMRDRLEDIDDLLLQDESPREMWAAITDEKVMRRALARELRTSRNHMYTVDQEAATADEKETDIRLRATRSNQQNRREATHG